MLAKARLPVDSPHEPIVDASIINQVACLSPFDPSHVLVSEGIVRKLMAQKRTKTIVRFPADASWRRNNMSRLLYTATWLFDIRILNIVNENGFPGLRMTHLHVPRNLDFEGTRLTELAIRAEMSKQAMGELVDQCETMGLVARRPHKDDRRAKMVCFTAEGHRLIEVVERALATAEREMLALIGIKRMEEVVSGLMTYCERRAVGPHRRRTPGTATTGAEAVELRRARRPATGRDGATN
jgi:DNA-binding MarR family transcriptional regulator